MNFCNLVFISWACATKVSGKTSCSTSEYSILNSIWRVETSNLFPTFKSYLHKSFIPLPQVRYLFAEQDIATARSCLPNIYQLMRITFHVPAIRPMADPRKSGSRTRFGTILVLSLLFSVVDVSASLSQLYCSNQNTGADFSVGKIMAHLSHKAAELHWPNLSASSIYQSNGKCFDTCVQNYAFAIVQYQQCWCSNYVPARTTSTGSCDQDCPGYPDEQCGSSSDGLFGYIALSKSPSGTLGVASNSPSTSAVVVQSSTQVVSTKSSGMVLPASSPSLSQASSISTLAASPPSSPPFLGLIISSPISISTSQVSSLTIFLTSLVQKSLPDPSPVTVQKTVTASPSVQISIVSIVSSLVCLNPSSIIMCAFAILYTSRIRLYLGMTEC